MGLISKQSYIELHPSHHSFIIKSPNIYHLKILPPSTKSLSELTQGKQIRLAEFVKSKCIDENVPTLYHGQKPIWQLCKA